MQEFSADMNSRAVKRIEDVSRLRQAQFPEDAGSMAHPIRPDSYVRMGEKFQRISLLRLFAQAFCSAILLVKLLLRSQTSQLRKEC